MVDSDSDHGVSVRADDFPLLYKDSTNLQDARRQARVLELLLRQFAAGLVAIRVVDAAEPPLVLPRRRAEADAAAGKGAEPRCEPRGLGRRRGRVPRVELQGLAHAIESTLADFVVGGTWDIQRVSG